MLISSCGGKNNTGYDAGFNSENPNKFKMLTSRSYRSNYKQGQEDGDIYDMGYADAKNGREINSQYKDDPDYMNGYKDGRNS